MTMRQDELPSPGLLPNGPRLCQEVATAINSTAIPRDLQGAPSSTGKKLENY